MSFGGGGGGASGVTAHTHNSGLTNDGGSLSIPLTQIADSNLYSRIIAGV